MMQNDKTRNSFFRNLATLGIPISLQNFLSFSTSLVNTMMVGKLGDEAISGVYVGNQIKTLLTVLLFGVEGAVLALSAQYHGKGDKESIKRILGIGTIFAEAVSISLTLVCISFPRTIVKIFTNDPKIVDTGADYLQILCISFVLFALTQVTVAALRSVESTKISFAASGFALFINIILGYVFVFGKFGAPRLEIKGAATATVCAHIGELILLLIYTLFFDKRLNIRVRRIFTLFKFERKLIMEFIKYGSPLILAQLVWGVNILFASAVMGRQGKAALSAMSIASALSNLAYIVTNGTAGALGVIIGKKIGEKRYKEVEKNAMQAQIIFILLGALTSLFTILIKDSFISIYDISSDTVREASRFIYVIAALTIGTCYQSAVLNGILKSAKDTKFVFTVEFVSVFFIIFPATLIASRLFAAPFIVFAALKCDQIIKCIPAALRVNKLKWLKNSM